MPKIVATQGTSSAVRLDGTFDYGTYAKCDETLKSIQDRVESAKKSSLGIPTEDDTLLNLSTMPMQLCLDRLHTEAVRFIGMLRKTVGLAAMVQHGLVTLEMAHSVRPKNVSHESINNVTTGMFKAISSIGDQLARTARTPNNEQKRRAALEELSGLESRMLVAAAAMLGFLQADDFNDVLKKYNGPLGVDGHIRTVYKCSPIRVYDYYKSFATSLCVFLTLIAGM